MWTALLGEVQETPYKILWNSLSLVGLRNARALLPQCYRDTTFYFDGVDDCVALTIDDALCRNGRSTSLISEVRQLLAKHEARCTFFTCGKYLDGVEDLAGELVKDGHEFGNHMAEDLAFHYNKLPPTEFASELRETTRAIEAQPNRPPVRWFRAPQGMLTEPMREAVVSQQLRHALGDAYCDDWAMEHNAPYVSRTLLSQCQAGSILILHMPEVGFREHTLKVLEEVLDGLSKRKLKCVTLTQAAEMSERGTGGGGAEPQPPPAEEPASNPVAGLASWLPLFSARRHGEQDPDRLVDRRLLQR